MWYLMVSAAVWKWLWTLIFEVGVKPVVCVANSLVGMLPTFPLSPAASRRHSRSTSALSTADPHSQSGDLHAPTPQTPSPSQFPPKFPILEAIMPSGPACFGGCVEWSDCKRPSLFRYFMFLLTLSIFEHFIQYKKAKVRMVKLCSFSM